MAERAMVVSSIEKGRETLVELLSAFQFDALDSAASAREALKRAEKYDYAVIVINAPLVDDEKNDLAVRLARDTQSGVVLLLHPHGAPFETAPADGVMTIVKPAAKTLIEQAVRHARAMHARLVGVRRENERLQLKLDEVRMVNRAKAMLIKHLSMSEDAAHRYIEKQAMDLRLSRLDVAKNILKNYSL